MSNKSDNNDKPRTNIFELLPEVYRSNLNDSLFEDVYNRHLTKDDLTHVAGFIGQRNPGALVNLQIKEPTPFRQAFQLEPTMYTKVGAVDHALTQKGFFSQLELMGVDIGRLQKWADTKQFNWVPPINIDMLVNFFDYYWPSSNPADAAQYLTIENRCARAKGKVKSYENIIAQFGDIHTLTGIDPKTNTFSVLGDFTALFVTGFVFFTTNTLDVNYAETFWTTASSVHNAILNTTTITVQEDIAIVSTSPPITTIVGRWWYDPTTTILSVWDGVAWVLAIVIVTGDISLSELLAVFQKEANCLCDGDFGWDFAPWDDNQIGTVVWDQALLAAISWPTEPAWILANGAPVAFALWYDTTNDQLKQRDPTNTTWIVVINKLSVLLVQITGQTRWDQTLPPTCEVPNLNQWEQQNKWVHKTQVASFGGVRRAQLPIIEYNSTIEMNEWSQVVYSWKYRADVGLTFTASADAATRFELEPVKGYATLFIGGKWVIYLFTNNVTLNRDIDYTESFTPGTKFLIVDDALLSDTFTVARSEYRKIQASDPVNAFLTGFALAPITDYYVTVVELVEPIFGAPTLGNGLLNTRVIPRTTSKGDTWRGYQVHWVLDTEATTTKAAGSQQLNPRLVESLASVLPQVVVPGGLLTVGISHQEFTATIAGVTTIPLDPSFLYTPVTSTPYATPGSNELRVYVNNIRQYGTYTETTTTGLPDYTLVGSTATTVAPIPYVTSITFTLPLKQFDIVRMEVGPASLDDMGRFAVPVRTVEDEIAFQAAVIAGTQPVYMSLVNYQHLEQVKTITNQYPYFDVYDVCTNQIVDASPIFAYKEDPSFPVDVNIGKRIVSFNSNKDFTFIQYLLDRDDNIDYGYRNLANAPAANTFWYSELQGTVMFWDGKAWNEKAFISTVNGLAERIAVISVIEPAALLTVDGALWLNRITKVLSKRDATLSTWVVVPQLIVSDSDPSFQTVWKTDDNDYVPAYVNGDRQPVPVGDPTGDWELLHQWVYNSEHKNKQQSNYSQLVTHFTSIIKQQPNVSGLPGGGVFVLTQNEYNYSLGGTIKEHNDSFDTLISAVNVTNTSPVGLLKWAREQYELGLLLIQDLFNRNAITLFTDFSQESLANQTAFITKFIEDQYKLNDFLALIYGDTTAYNPDTQVGMPNWIATLPIFLLSEKHVPHLVVDDFVELYHHDGHRTRISYTPGEVDRFARTIVGTSDLRVAGGKLGVQSASTPPATAAAFLTAFGGVQVRSGVYWYQLAGGIQTLYRFIPFAVQGVDPAFFLNGVELLDGTRYYNSLTTEVRKKVGLSWVVETSLGDIHTLWEQIIFAERLAAVDLDVEQRLYDAVPFATSLKFDYNTTFAAEPTVYASEFEKRFFAFVAEKGLKAPLVNTTYSPTNAFTWNYVSSNVTSPPRPGPTPANASAWQELYTRWYGTPYPHLEPWVLQGYADKPTWWDTQYLNDGTGVPSTRRWKYNHLTTTGMWENIRTGVVPAGRLLPDGNVSTGAPGQVQQYFYFSVNISNVAVGGVQPDELFPPYLSATTVGFAPSVRSLFDTISQVVAPDADYTFGDVGPTEWQWTVSADFVYDIPTIAFIMQPVRFMHFAFGVNFFDVDKLQMEIIFCQVYSHEDALFHGDLYNTNVAYVANGLNQWYVNFNRFSGFDTNNEFRQLWAGWNPQQSYSFAGIVDTSTFDITTKFFDTSTEDYKIILANTGVFKDLWSEGFEVSVITIPIATLQYNNQAAWRFDLDSLATVDRTLTTYSTKQYPFAVDVATDVCTLFRYDVIAASSVSKRFYVTGNQTAIFVPDLAFTVQGSSFNDGAYTVSVSAFESVSNRTRISVNEPVPSSVGDGRIDLTAFSMPWQTGQSVIISSSKNLPAPIVADTPYFIIRTGPRTFKLAETVGDATAVVPVPIDMLTTGDGEVLVGETVSSFVVFGGASNSKEIWYHYALDKTKLITYTPPTSISGMQNLINFFDAYQEYQKDTGIGYNLGDNPEFDETTGRTTSWQLEIERFIDWAYNLRNTRLSVNDRYDCSVNGVTPTQELLFGPAQPAWESGTAISFSTTSALPAPLIANTPYYFVATDTPGVFKVSITSDTSLPANLLTFTTPGSGTMVVSQFRLFAAFPSFEINPTRNNVWIDTPQGLMADVVTGPFNDIHITQTIFDQYGKALSADKLNIFRQDAQTRIAMRPLVNDPLNLIPQALKTQYDYLHMGGGHFFLEGYEHIILFNDYAVDGSLIYDQFYGLFASRFNLDFYKSANYTLRPTLGGYYLVGGEFFRNIEGSTVDLHNFYDTYALREGTVQARYARNLLGYPGKQDFLNLVNMNAKSQFVFYRGMIHYKGSVAGAKAYINSRRFIDAKIDEFWAWKVAEFGDARPRVYPQIKLFSTDSLLQELRLHFLATLESTSDVDVVAAEAEGFKPVEWTDPTRWQVFPEQKAEILSPLFLDAEISSFWRVYVSGVIPTAGQNLVDFWFDTGTLQFKTWDGTTWNVVANPPISIRIVGATTYAKLDQPFDAARALRRKLLTPGDLRQYQTTIYDEGTGVEEFQQVNSEVLKFQTSGFSDIMMLFTVNPAFSKINPSKLIDTKSNVVITNVQLWDPARGDHSSKAIHNVSIQHAGDPASYTVTINPSLTTLHAWGQEQTQTIWLDTDALGYKKYYDDKLNPNINDRLNTWGKLADWASVNVYEWTSSTVPPAQWASAGQQQSGDILRPQRSKATGTARQTLFKRARNTYTAAIVGITSGSQVISFGGTATGLGLTGIVDDSTFGLQDILFTATPVPANPTGLTGTAPFMANIFVDGTGHLVSVTSVSANTYANLLIQINAALLGTATATIVGNNIRITSASRGVGSTIVVQDVNLFGSLNVAPAVPQTPVNGAAGTIYTATITIDGTLHNISMSSHNATIYNDVISQINTQLGGAGTAAIVGGNITVTSATTGTSSTVLVTAGTLFTAMTFFAGLLAAVVGTFGTVQVPTGTFALNAIVLFSTTGTLPTPIVVSTKYVVTSVTPAGPNDLLTIATTATGPNINISTSGTGTLTVVPAFKTADWIKSPVFKERQYGSIQFTVPSVFEPTITLTNVGWAEFDLVNVYINDQLKVSGYQLTTALTVPLAGTGITVFEKDIIDIVRPLHTLTAAETSFDPDTADDGATRVQWKYDFEYSSFTTISGNTPQVTYYFWVQNSQYRNTTDNNALSAFEVAQQLTTIPTPYFTVHEPKDDPSLLGKYGYGLSPYGTVWSLADLAEQSLIIPVFYREAVLHKAANYITEDDRFVWRFTRDLSLRYTLNGRNNLKAKHEEWFLIRREQPTVIPRELWDRLTEALIGYTLADNTVRVPSLERELYDAVNNTDTRFGLGVDQAFCDKTFGLDTVLAYLEDPANDFSPVDIDNFFATHTFDTPANIQIAMNDIFNTFSTQHTNNIWFNTLLDAFATRAKYKEILKTSWVALHGIRVLEVGGIFDD